MYNNMYTQSYEKDRIMHGWPAHIIHTYVRTVDDITLPSCNSSSLSNIYGSEKAHRHHRTTIDDFSYNSVQHTADSSAPNKCCMFNKRLWGSKFKGSNPLHATIGLAMHGGKQQDIMSFIAAYNVPHKSADALLYMVHVGTSPSHAQIRACRGQNTQFHPQSVPLAVRPFQLDI